MSTDSLTHAASPEVVSELVALAWSTFVGSELVPMDEPSTVEQPVCAAISISGPWSATLLLSCDRTVAVASTASVLGMTEDEVTDADLLDIMGELANIVGGNLKGAISDDQSTWKLSLPVVSTGMQTVPGSKLSIEIGFMGAWGGVNCQLREHAT
jgi:chemotaxis protein CheX